MSKLNNLTLDVSGGYLMILLVQVSQFSLVVSLISGFINLFVAPVSGTVWTGRSSPLSCRNTGA